MTTSILAMFGTHDLVRCIAYRILIRDFFRRFIGRDRLMLFVAHVRYSAYQ